MNNTQYNTIQNSTYLPMLHLPGVIKLIKTCALKHMVVGHGHIKGGGTGGSQSPASRTPFSRLPYVFVPLSPDSRPLLCFSCYHVNQVVGLPIQILNRECFGFVQNKKLCCKSNHSTLSSAIIEGIEEEFLRHKFTPGGKIFTDSVL